MAASIGVGLVNEIDLAKLVDKVRNIGRKLDESRVTGLEEIPGDFPEADFWPGVISGLSFLGLRPAKPYEND